MNDSPGNRRFGNTFVLGLVVFVLLFCAAGLFILFRQFPPGAWMPPPGTPVPLGGDGTPLPTGEPTEPGEGEFRMQVQLSEGKSEPEQATPVTVAAGEVLSAEDANRLLERLPTLQPGDADQVAFNRPPESIKRPQPGVTIKDQFPPIEAQVTPNQVTTGPLQVLRYAPEGEISIAPFISVTFNQPMVPVGTLADLANQAVPVKIEPELPGTWRWLGVKTLTFQYDSTLIDRLPQATRYTVTVPSGIKSVNGAVLESTVSWSFTTPAPKVLQTYPDSYESQPLEPVFFVSFDQRIDPDAVLKTIKVFAGSQQASLVLANESDLKKDPRAEQLTKSAQEGRWLAFRATRPFPQETTISVTIGPETPSAEGPLTTSDAQSYSFSTYAPLKIVESTCGWGGPCTPLSPFYIRFNNNLDADAFRETMVGVSPEIPGASATVSGNTLVIQGETVGQTAYAVSIAGEISDIFGQQLGQSARLTFRVGRSEPVLVGPNRNFVTLDPESIRPALSIYAMNYNTLNVKVYAVQPDDWDEYQQYLQNWHYQQDVKMPGSVLQDRDIALDLKSDTLEQVDIDLGQWMQGKSGNFALIISPPKPLIEDENARWRREWQTVVVWVQVTQLGLDAFSDYDQTIAWVTNLKNGGPVQGARVSYEGGSSSVTSDETGVARIPSVQPGYVLARTQDDMVFLPNAGHGGYRPVDTLRWYAFNDRGMYRPGEQVRLKGWLRMIGAGRNGDVTLPQGVRSVSYELWDATGNSIAQGSTAVSVIGGFDLTLDLPKNANLGQTTLRLRADNTSISGSEFYHYFQVQEFRRPEFEVSARNETEGPYFSGTEAVVAVEAKYYAGGGLPNADTTWQVTTSTSSYSPPNWPEFTFGSWRPWWIYYDYASDIGFPGFGGDSKTETFTGKTDASGTHYLKLRFESQGSKDPHPQSVTAQATVMDVNRQAWSAATSLLVHPADVYIGLRSQAYFVERGTPIRVDFIVTDLDGKPVSGRPVEIRAVRLEWKVVKGEWTQQEIEPQKCTMVSTNEPAFCEFGTPVGGEYQITAVVTDAKDRKNQSRFTRWVSGGKSPVSRNVEQEKVTLIPDKETYQPGNTAQVLVQSPFAPAEGLLTVSRDGILSTTRFHVDESGSITLTVPIKEEHIPNLNIQVDLSGSTRRTDDQGQPLDNVPLRPAFATGSLSLRIPPLQRTLQLEVLPDAPKLDPGSQTSLTVRLKDANGNPVSDAELAVVVVDEAILALSNYRLADPISSFYSDRSSLLSSVYGRSSILLVDPKILAAAVDQQQNSRVAFEAGAAPSATQALSASEAPMMEDGMMNRDKGASNQPAIQVRSNFDPLALFAPEVRTGLDGVARIPFKLPDNLTRYRVMVIAVDVGGQRFGQGESNLTARLPLMVRPSAPRFLNFGDQFELPVILQNQTDSPLTVDVAARATNLKLAVSGLRVIVPANDRVEVRFPANADLAGTARIQIAAASGSYADAATIELPVYTPSTTEAFATYGVIDQGSIAQPILYPKGVFPQYGGLEVSTSSTAVQSLTDAVLYLVAYPYECSEQLASRILAVAALRDVLTAFDADGLPSPAEMESAVTRDIARLEGMQNDDGGFPYWKRGFESNPFNTIHVTHALIRARRKGFDVPQGMLDRAMNYLRNIEQYYPSWYGVETRRTLSAYAVFVRNLNGDRDPGKASQLLTDAGLENLSMEAVGWLWPVIDDSSQLTEIRRFVGNRVVETPGAANFTTSYSDQTYLLLSSDRRTDAILLDALIDDDPQSDLIVKVVNGLLAHRTKGRWGNTQENVFVLLALDRYFNTYEKQTPDFVARIWLGDVYAGSGEFRGRTTDRHETIIPMSYVLNETAGGSQNLLLDKEGPGRLYYRIGLRYAPTDFKLPALDMGFVVERTYEGVDDPKDAYRDKDGVWHIKAGARVRVKIKMVADNRRYHVALVDPLPAGLEIVNPELAVSGSVPQDPSASSGRYGWWWWSSWYEHQNMRDDRAEAFASLVWDGVYEYSYVTRATTPGTFVVPPTKAEEMYSPEVFGRSASDVVIVK